MTRPTFTISVPGYVPVTVTLEPAATLDGPTAPPAPTDAAEASGAGKAGANGHILVVKVAPRLHQRKVPPRHIVQARKVAWHRYWKALTVIEYQRANGMATPQEGAA